MGESENKALVERFYDEVWDRGNVDFAREVFHDDYIRHDLRPTQAAPGAAGMAAIAAGFPHGVSPTLAGIVDLVLAEGDLVAARWTATGTFTGPWGADRADGQASGVLRRQPLSLPGRQGRRDLEPPRRPRADAAGRRPRLRRRGPGGATRGRLTPDRDVTRRGPVRHPGIRTTQRQRTLWERTCRPKVGRWVEGVARVAGAGLLAVRPGGDAGTRRDRGRSRGPRLVQTPPVTIAEVVRVTEGPGGPACFGGQLLTFRAFVPALEGLGGASTYFIKPLWLDDLQGSWVLLGAGRNTAAVVAYVPPDLGHCLGPEGPSCPFRSYRNRWATVSAHFDGPVAQTCRYGGDVLTGWRREGRDRRVPGRSSSSSASGPTTSQPLIRSEQVCPFTTTGRHRCSGL